MRALHVAAMAWTVAATVWAGRAWAQAGQPDSSSGAPVAALATLWPSFSDEWIGGWVASSRQAASGRIRVPPRAVGLSGGVAGQLGVAFPLAIAKLDNLSSCRDLFAPFAMDGFSVLAQTRYTTAPKTLGPWQGGAFAYTTVGGLVVTLCEGFAALPPSVAAAVLLHEALHAAGLGEWPVEAEAATSSATTAAVRSACAL